MSLCCVFTPGPLQPSIPRCVFMYSDTHECGRQKSRAAVTGQIDLKIKDMFICLRWTQNTDSKVIHIYIGQNPGKHTYTQVQTGAPTQATHILCTCTSAWIISCGCMFITLTERGGVIRSVSVILRHTSRLKMTISWLQSNRYY